MSGFRMQMVFLAIFVSVIVGVGFAIGLTVRPGDWYQSLDKNSTPPSWVFGPVWKLVYI